MEYEIDATGKKLGRVATEVASVLMGKNRPDFVRNSIPKVSVIVRNAGSLDISGKKKEQKEYKRFSGYPSGLKISSMEQVLGTKGIQEVLRTAVKGMLPKNKLKKDMLKNLTIHA